MLDGGKTVTIEWRIYEYYVFATDSEPQINRPGDCGSGFLNFTTGVSMRSIGVAKSALLVFCGFFMSSSVHALATIEYSLSNVSCTITRASGVTDVPCSEPSFVVSLGEMESAMASATLTYTYHDDGLPLAMTTWPPFNVDPYGGNSGREDFEAGGISIFSKPFNGRGGFMPGVNVSNSDQWLSLGSNFVPDDISGQVAIFSKVSIGQYAGYSGEVSVYVSQAYAFSAPVPEPSSYYLLAMGLLSLFGYQRKLKKKA